MWEWDNLCQAEPGSKYFRCRYCGDEIVVGPCDPPCRICQECREQIEMGLEPIE